MVAAFGIPHPVWVLSIQIALIREIFACGILNPGLWNPENSSKNPESYWRLESRIQVLHTEIGIQYLESGIRDEESRIQDCLGFLYMGRIQN